MAQYTFTKVFSTEADGELALDQGYRQSNLDTAFVRNTNRLYRWFAASTTAPVGDLIVAPANADPSAPGRWFLQGPPSTVFDPAKHSQVVPPGFNASCCYTISSRDDLLNIAQLSGNNFILPSGCFILENDIVLPDNETIWCVGGNFRIEGRGHSIQARSGSEVLRLDAISSLIANDLTLIQQQPVTTPAYLVFGGVSILRRCNFRGDASDPGTVGMLVLDGDVYAWDCEFTGGKYGGLQFGGRVFANQCLFESSNENGWFMDEGDIVASESVFRALAADHAIDSSGIARLFLTECELTTVPDGGGIPILLLDGAARATIRGGRIFGNVAAQDIGIRCAGGSGSYPILDGVQFSQLTTAIWNLAGGIPDAALLGSNSSDDTVAEGVNWTTARIPPNGLVEWGNQFNTATPYVGHNPLVVERVNRKANTEAGALSSETPIV